jgi:carboxypeptidase Q
VVQVRDVEALARMESAKIEGKIVYFSARMERARDGAGYGKTVAIRTAGPSAAASKGALAVVIRSVGTSNARLPHTGTTVYNIGSPRIPAVAISNPDADLLERQLAMGKPLVLQVNVTARDLPQTRSANVIGEIPGTDKAEEIVLLAAHLDSWDLGTGALDDGAGIAIITAAAHMLKDIEPKPRRTIRVVHFANEEFGLSGSRAYTEHVISSNERHALAMEADVGAGPVYSLESRVAPEQLALIKQIWTVLEPLGVERGGNRASGGADISALRAHGVPVMSPRLDATSYFDYHHTANDTLDKVDPKAIAQSATAFAVAAYLAARVEQSWMPLEGGS